MTLTSRNYSVANNMNSTKWPKHVTMQILGHIIQNNCGLNADWARASASMWKCFWASCGSRSHAKSDSIAKAHCLQRNVVSNFQWRLSRWPFQKGVAVLIDKLQCRMFSYIIKYPRGEHEHVDHFCRRRLRSARNLAGGCGKWSLLWCRRVVAWDAHVKRGRAYNHFAYNLLTFHNDNWLIMQRSLFVGIEDFRNSVYAGRTGTRLNIGRPQQRWGPGVQLAKDCLSERDMQLSGRNVLSISNIVRNAVLAAREIRSYTGND